MERLAMNRMGASGRVVLAAACLGLSLGAFAQEPGAGDDDLEVVESNSLDDLLQNVLDRRVVESREHVRREAEFRERKDQQAKLLADARAEKRRQEQRSKRLDETFEENERRMGELQKQYDDRLGGLRELFGVLQQIAGDTRAKFHDSVVSAELPGRGEWLGELAAKMGKSTELATISRCSSYQTCSIS